MRTGNASEVPNESRSKRRAKAFECLSLAEGMNDPERRAEILRYARLWMQLAEPIGTSRSAYEVEPAIAPLSVNIAFLPLDAL